MRDGPSYFPEQRLTRRPAWSGPGGQTPTLWPPWWRLAQGWCGHHRPLGYRPCGATWQPCPGAGNRHLTGRWVTRAVSVSSVAGESARAILYPHCPLDRQAVRADEEGRALERGRGDLGLARISHRVY